MAFALAVLAPAGPAIAQTCADADGSGIVSVTDGVLALQSAAGIAGRCETALCDLDGSGSVSVSDGVNVLRAAAGLAVTFACPGAGPACTTADVTVDVATPTPIGAATLELAYPASAVTLPGSGDAAAARVTILTATSLLANGSPNDLDDHVRFTLVAGDGLASGDLLRVRFDCLGAATGADAFACTLADVTATDGVTGIDGAPCSVTVTSE